MQKQTLTYAIFAYVDNPQGSPFPMVVERYKDEAEAKLKLTTFPNRITEIQDGPRGVRHKTGELGTPIVLSLGAFVAPYVSLAK